MSSTPQYHGLPSGTTAQEVEDSPQRKADRSQDTLTRRYLVREAGRDGAVPAFGTADATFTTHEMSGYSWKKIPHGDVYELTLEYRVPTYEGNCLIATAPLPPDEVEIIGGTTERHIGAHPDYSSTWLGFPETNGIDDPRGLPTVAPTKPGVENYMMPTGLVRKTTYSHTLPTTVFDKLGKRNIPTPWTGVNKWLCTGVNVKITKGVYAISTEWTYLVYGTWDADIYEAG